MPSKPKSAPKKRTPRVTAAEKEQRVSKVYEMLVAGARRSQILQYVAKEEWKVEPRQVDNYIAEANGQIAAEAEYHRQREFGRAIAALNDLYQRCMKVQDYARALAARRELNALLSLYVPPAPQTLRILGIDEAQLVKLVEGLAKRGYKASDGFEAMIQELAALDDYE